MKKTPLFILILASLVFSLAGIAYSWQGRMAGMGDPYGLIKDESDFLIHPAGIAKGEGIKFYGHYRFNYTDVMDWNYTLNYFDPTTGALIASFPFRGSGDEQEHNGLLGAAFPLGPGRMGLFFQYSGKRGDYDGKENAFDFLLTSFNRYSLNSDLDAFALRLLYGLPLGGFKLGGEIQLAYRNEKNKTFFNGEMFTIPMSLTNYPPGAAAPVSNLFPFMFPYDSKYWEALLKGSLKGAIGPAKVAFTIWGGIIFGGDNKLDYSGVLSGIGPAGFEADGNVKGWRIGSDFWLRYPLAKDLSLPFLLKVGYQNKTRDGNGLGSGILVGATYDYKNKEKIFQLEVGGGLDKELVKGMKIAAGLYYGFLQNKNSFSLFENTPAFWTIFDHNKYPDQTEHRVILRIAGEKEISPMVAMRMGMSFFYGWVKEDFNFKLSNAAPATDTTNQSLDGSHWGIGVSLGATVKFQRFSLEPFIGGGYQKFDIDGDGFDTGTPARLEMDKLRKEWSVGGGLSIKF